MQRQKREQKKICRSTLVECCVSQQQPSLSLLGGKRLTPFLGLSQTRPDCPNAFVLSIIFPSSMDSHIPFVVDLIFPLVHSLEVSDLVFMQFYWVLVNCQNRRNCDVPGAAGFEPGSMRQRLKHRLRTQSRTSPHLLLQLTNLDMSHFTCTDSPHP